MRSKFFWIFLFGILALGIVYSERNDSKKTASNYIHTIAGKSIGTHTSIDAPVSAETPVTTAAPAPQKKVPAPVVVQKPVFSCPKQKLVSVDYTLLSLPSPTLNLENYIPNNLVQVSYTYTGGKDICLTKDTYNAYLTMLAAMKKDGLAAHIVSGYRTGAQQIAVQGERGDLAAVVGQSEHHLGTAIDLDSANDPVIFDNTKEYQWLLVHGWEYGFVQSYLPDMTDQTGFQGESWHWRYVGVAVANAVRQQNVALDKYLATK